jgi:hypothetical protein
MKIFNIVKYNWNSKFLLGSFIVNTGLTYYKYNVDGTSGICPLIEFCNESTHIFSSTYRSKGGLGCVIEPLITTGILGCASVPITGYNVYKNHLNNKKYENNKGTNEKYSCECGEIKN